MPKKLSTNGVNGRNSKGQFTKGNEGGPGNPHSKKVAKLRSALIEAVTPADLRKMTRAMVRAAQNGDVAAYKVLAEHLLGKPSQRVEVSSESALLLNWDALVGPKRNDVIEDRLRLEENKGE